jgi:hypothetical protein
MNRPFYEQTMEELLLFPYLHNMNDRQDDFLVGVLVVVSG